MTPLLHAVDRAAGPGRVILDLNESAYGPLPEVAAALSRAVEEANRYPEFLPDTTRRTIAAHMGVEEGRVTVGAGGTGVIAAALQMSLRDNPYRVTESPEFVTPTPTFGGYPLIARMLGLQMTGVPLDVLGRPDLDAVAAAVGPRTVAVAICSPHNPTGAVVDSGALAAVLGSLPDRVTVIVDQAYIEFASTAPDLEHLLTAHPRIVVVRTFSKAYGLAGLRVGYGIGSPETITALRQFEMPFGVATPAAAAVPVSLAQQSSLAARIARMRAERTELEHRLRAVGARPLASEANFLFVPGAAGIALGEVLTACGVAVKQYRPYGVRITVGDVADTDALLRALHTVAATAS